MFQFREGNLGGCPPLGSRPLGVLAGVKGTANRVWAHRLDSSLAEPPGCPGGLLRPDRYSNLGTRQFLKWANVEELAKGFLRIDSRFDVCRREFTWVGSIARPPSQGEGRHRSNRRCPRK